MAMRLWLAARMTKLITDELLEAVLDHQRTLDVFEEL